MRSPLRRQKVFLEIVKAKEADTCIFYGFVGPTEDDYIICREGYVSAEGVLQHLNNVGEVLGVGICRYC